jgi:hypothetical protein
MDYDEGVRYVSDEKNQAEITTSMHVDEGQQMEMLTKGQKVSRAISRCLFIAGDTPSDAARRCIRARNFI